MLARPDCRYGRCVYHAGIRVVDHQSVLVSFEDGATGTLSMNGGAAQGGRSILVTGTRGQIEGSFERQTFRVTRIDPAAPGGCVAEQVDVSAQQCGDAHGGGDNRILDDFFRLLDGEKPSFSCTSLENSIIGHEIAYAAEEDRIAQQSACGGFVRIQDDR